MSNITTINGQLIAKDSQRFAILVGRFNGFINESLLEGAKDALLRSGASAENISVIYVPGAFEIPLIAQKCANRDFDAVIALGSVIRGSTAHFDFVAGESAKGLSKVQLDSGKPIINGILTTDSIEQAIERAGTKAGNKGAEAAITAIEMLNVLEQI